MDSKGSDLNSHLFPDKFSPKHNKNIEKSEMEDTGGKFIKNNHGDWSLSTPKEAEKAIPPTKRRASSFIRLTKSGMNKRESVSPVGRRESMASLVQRSKTRRNSMLSMHKESKFKIFSYYVSNNVQFVDLTNPNFIVNKYSPQKLKQIKKL